VSISELCATYGASTILGTKLTKPSSNDEVGPKGRSCGCPCDGLEERQQQAQRAQAEPPGRVHRAMQTDEGLHGALEIWAKLHGEHRSSGL